MGLRAGRGSGVVVAVGLVVTLAVGGCDADATRDDSGPGQTRREHTVQRLQAGDLAVEGPPYTVLAQDPLVVFFQTWHGIGPDPYCGYEYASDPAAIVLDPLGSGEGHVERFKDGWYWLCAS